MKFTLEMSLDNAEVEELGLEEAIATYLRSAAVTVLRMGVGAVPKQVRDGNGNRIGFFDLVSTD